MKNKLLCIYILISILLSCIFPIISNAEYNSYIALGDSIPTGYGLESPAFENYAELLRQKSNIKNDKFKNLAITGETTEDFYSTIQTENYTNAIKQAELITISIGANEILEIVKEAVSVATGVEITETDFNEKAANTFFKADLFDKITMLFTLYDYCTTQDIPALIDTKIARYHKYWKKSIEYIKQVNPDVEIVVTEFYNAYYGISLLNYDFGGFVGNIMERMNSILWECSDSEENYKIAKIYSTFNSTNPKLTNVNLSLTNLNIDPHPNALGHEIISLKILEAIYGDNNSNKKDISKLSISNVEDKAYTGQEIKPKLEIKDGNSVLVQDQDYVLVYNNNVKLGQANIIIFGVGDYTGKVTKTFNITNTARKEISKCDIIALDTQLYLGMNLEPEVIIEDGKYTLVEDQDYTLTYSNNMNVGVGTIIINGIGNYQGTETTNFIIAPQFINMSEIQDIPEQLYTGKAITPDVIVTFGASKLTENTDYTVKYENNVEIGTAKITIEGKGNFTGTTTREFDIVETLSSTDLKDFSKIAVEKITDKTYSGNAITPETVVTYNRKVLIKNVDYKTFYNNNINVGTASITLVGMGEYSGTIEKTFNIVAKSLENIVINDIPDQVYTGKSIKPTVLLSDGAKKLKLNEDYTLKYSNNIEVGTATIEIFGTGNYTGKLTKTFNIIKNENENPPITPSDNTITNENLPNAGAGLTFFITILAFGVIAVISYRLYKKW